MVYGSREGRLKEFEGLKKKAPLAGELVIRLRNEISILQRVTGFWKTKSIRIFSFQIPILALADQAVAGQAGDDGFNPWRGYTLDTRGDVLGAEATTAGRSTGKLACAATVCGA